MEYQELTEKIWCEWKANRLSPKPSQYISSKFSLDYLPEPYLQYGDGDKPMYFLSTNPGALNNFQKRESILQGHSEVDASKEYAEVAKSLARFYSSPRFKKKSKSRIQKQVEIQNLMGRNSLITFECFPFHSPNLPKKERLITQLDDLLNLYRASLKTHLKDKSILYVSAIGTRSSISRKGIESNSWLVWVMDLIDLDFQNAKIHPLKSINGKITTALFLDKKATGLYKGITLMQGSNNFPKDVTKITDILKA